MRWFLDTHTGSTLLLNAEYDPAQNNGLTASQVEADEARFRPVPTSDLPLTLVDMASFAGQTTDMTLKESLELALAGLHPERRFRAVLSWLPEEQTRWHSYRLVLLEERARDWLKHLGLAP